MFLALPGIGRKKCSLGEHPDSAWIKTKGHRRRGPEALCAGSRERELVGFIKLELINYILIKIKSGIIMI
jgi:hypothetical protein